MDSSTQIRKIPPSLTTDLINILENGECWKRLMSIIPKSLSRDHYQADLTLNNPRKYRSEHFCIIEDASVKTKTPCAAILLDEWGCSGRVLPTVGHLFHLLVKAQLFRAADYVAEALLKIDPPRRPSKGPAAKVHFQEFERPLSAPHNNNNGGNNNDSNIERMLDEMNYPSSAIRKIVEQSSINTNKNYETSNLAGNHHQVVPKIVISESPDDQEHPTPEFKAHNRNRSASMKNSRPENSDLMQFSSDGNAPENLQESVNNPQPANLPQLSLIASYLEQNSGVPTQNNDLVANNETSNSDGLSHTNSNYVTSQSSVSSSRSDDSATNSGLSLLNSARNIPQLSGLLCNNGDSPDLTRENGGPTLPSSHGEQVNSQDSIPGSQSDVSGSQSDDSGARSTEIPGSSPEMTSGLSLLNSARNIPQISGLLYDNESDATEKNGGPMLPDSRAVNLVNSEGNMPKIHSLLNNNSGGVDANLSADNGAPELPNCQEKPTSESANVPNLNETNAHLPDANADVDTGDLATVQPCLSHLMHSENPSPGSQNESASNNQLPAFSQLLLQQQNSSSLSTTSGNPNKNDPASTEGATTAPSHLKRGSREGAQLQLPSSPAAGAGLLLLNHNNNNTVSNGSSRPVISRQCSSPLPNLSLNTVLPHFTYAELEHATNGFDETASKQGGRFLGGGAFGKVYLALGLMNKPVAVKKLLLDSKEVVTEDDVITKQFKNEVEVLCLYKHENLLSLLGYSCDGCTYCLLYDYVPGGALKDRLKNKESKLIWTERLYIAIGTAKAISYLHSAFETPLIHRDVKTANILLDLTNKPKLCDFGIMKLSPNQNTSTATTVLGTSVYMAPEAFRGNVSVKLDTYSFGVVLLELLTSLPPLDKTQEGLDLVSRVEEHCENSIKSLLDTSAGPWTANNIEFSEELFKMARSCLQEKRKRPNMVEITAQLSDLIQKCA